MSEYEQETMSTVELVLAVERMSTLERQHWFDGIFDTMRIFETYTKTHIRSMVESAEAEKRWG